MHMQMAQHAVRAREDEDEAEQLQLALALSHSLAEAERGGGAGGALGAHGRAAHMGEGRGLGNSPRRTPRMEGSAAALDGSAAAVARLAASGALGRSRRDMAAPGLAGSSTDLSYERLVELEDVAVGIPPELIELACPQILFADAATFRAAAATADMGDAGDCPVCLSEFEAEDGVRLLPCMHVFHVGCIDGWLCRSKSCPTCKAELLLDS
jgi:hypothetical protein